MRPGLRLVAGRRPRSISFLLGGDTSRTCVPLARRCALGKANDASGLTEESRYTIHRVDAHAEKSAGRGARLSHLAAGVGTAYRPRTTHPGPGRTMRQGQGDPDLLPTSPGRAPSPPPPPVPFSPPHHRGAY